MQFAVGHSSLRYDGAGNSALGKSGRRSRIDALQAAVIAVGLAEVVSPTGEGGGWTWA